MSEACTKGKRANEQDVCSCSLRGDLGRESHAGMERKDRRLLRYLLSGPCGLYRNTIILSPYSPPVVPCRKYPPSSAIDDHRDEGPTDLL